MRIIGALLFLIGIVSGQVAPWLQRELLDRSGVVVLARFEGVSQVSAVVQLSRFAVERAFKGGDRDIVRVGDLADMARISKGTPALLFLKEGASGFVHSTLEMITLDASQVLLAIHFMDGQLKLAGMPHSPARDETLKLDACTNLSNPLGLARRAALHDLRALAQQARPPFTWDDLVRIEEAEVPRDLREVRHSLVSAVRKKVLGPGARILEDVTSASDRNKLGLALQRLRAAANPTAALPVQIAAMESLRHSLLRMVLLDASPLLRRAGLECCMHAWSGDPPAELFELPAGVTDEELGLRIEVVGRTGGAAELPWLRKRSMEARCREQTLTAIARLQLAEGDDLLRTLAEKAPVDTQGQQLRLLVTHLLSAEFRKAEGLRRAGTRRY